MITIIGTRMSNSEKQTLAEFLAGKQEKEKKKNEDFQKTLDSEIKKLEPDTRPKLNDSNKMQ